MTHQTTDINADWHTLISFRRIRERGAGAGYVRSKRSTELQVQVLGSRYQSWRYTYVMFVS